LAKRFYYGGQAVIEGVMMRGKKSMVTVVRRPNGELAIDVQPLPNIYTGWARRAPFLRGIIVLIEALVLGIKSLLYSANMSLEEEEGEISGGLVWVLVGAAIALAVVLFFIAPLFLTKLFAPFITSAIVFNLIEGGLRLLIFIAYLALVGLVPELKRVFSYHGAEHKAVNAYEEGMPLEPEAVRVFNITHVRCGTSFLLAVLVIAILVFSLVGLPALWLMVLSRIVLIPVIAALGYEFTYFGASHIRSRFARILIAPGLWLQKLTTREPDESQLEVALVALKKVVELDQPEEVSQASS